MRWGGLGEERRRSPPILNKMPPVQPGTAQQQPTTTGHALVLEGVTRTFGALRAIEDVSFSVAAGERRALIGANGAGKTTLFNAITGDFPPTAGRVRFFGEDVTAMPPHERIRMGLRRTYQSSLLFRDLSVRDNLFLAVRGVARGRYGFLRPRAALHPVRRAGRRPLSGGAARAGRAARRPAHPHELHHHRARPGRGAAGGRAGHRDAQRPRAQARHPGRDRGRRRRAGHLHRGRAPLMRWFSRPRRARSSQPILVVEKLDVYYGRAHALQEVSLSLDHGVTAVVGKNGMGKTTLCNAITGLVPAAGSVRLDGEEILGLPPNAITDRGVGYVPQGRRVWPSLTVDEHLRLASRDRSGGPWTVARVYQTFPRLAERKGNGGAELSGGEQQMLAIARALLFNPILLVMDEPTEGLAPIIVQQV